MQVPIGYWKLNETQGNRAEDSSGNGHHGTYKDGVRLGVAGKVGKAANMNGTGYVDTPVGMNDLWTSDRAARLQPSFDYPIIIPIGAPDPTSLESISGLRGPIGRA